MDFRSSGKACLADMLASKAEVKGVSLERSTMVLRLIRHSREQAGQSME
jgi:hypothetical protein